MKIFASSMENASTNDGTPVCKLIVDMGIQMRWNLMSFYYMKGKREVREIIRDYSDEILIDSGAFSFQRGSARCGGKEIEAYTRAYAAFIREFDRPNVLGYFEMDIDNIIGYDKVVELRKILENDSGHPSKIIPVWHKGRGIDEFINHCEKQGEHGGIVGITGFKDEDISDDQYIMFVKEAHKHGAKLHCLGMTRKDVLDKVPFDYTDSSSWVQKSIRGGIGNYRVSLSFSKTQRGTVFVSNYLNMMKKQEYYYNKWWPISRD